MKAQKYKNSTSSQENHKLFGMAGVPWESMRWDSWDGQGQILKDIVDRGVQTWFCRWESLRDGPPSPSSSNLMNCVPLSVCPAFYSLSPSLSAYLVVLSGCDFAPSPGVFWNRCSFVVVTLIGGGVTGLRYVCGGGRHTKRPAVHGTVPPLDNRPVKMPVLRPSNPPRRNTGPYSSAAFVWGLPPP